MLEANAELADTPAQIAAGMQELTIQYSDEQLEKLVAYLELLRKWNRKFNLVGTSDPNILARKHLLDSLAIASYVPSGQVLDVGSGAGLPGIPLAITLPNSSFTLIDTNGKKTRFMRQVAIELNLENVEVQQIDIAKFEPIALPKTVLARAFAPLEQTLALLYRVCDHSGKIMIMLGKQAADIPFIEGLSRIITQKINVPGLESNRHLLIAHKI